jgi:outer membrane protein assembly factor BamB
VLVGGHLYGLDGDHGGRGSALRCIEFETGKVKWTEASVKPGGLMAADGKLIVLSEPGELIIAPASPDSFKAIARAQVMGGKCWTTPVLSHGRIYCRNAKGDVVCVDVSAKTAAAAP